MMISWPELTMLAHHFLEPTASISLVLGISISPPSLRGAARLIEEMASSVVLHAVRISKRPDMLRRVLRFAISESRLIKMVGFWDPGV